ncbi:MAG TPA: riboflavin synthase [Acidiphilium sp.]|nr:MAG: riboflavin synthase [Acidiphilium sp. 21-60-14]OYV92402.1 MAG: riboflavin synthase [Acidiphilium sp. 37-60-79]OZB40165.1 MAG: riboflavin synthase [Acidiphilium sp. 34-60-192]HQT87873.1 riboflavin synthase [Acidiphilium sp.]HQU24878.1 riboflavin synthase [Acidiphilium sp.]
MFTGIITAIGRVRSITPATTDRDSRFILEVPHGNAQWADLHAIALGASICCSGCCLTVIEAGTDWFAVDVSNETLSKTTLGQWVPGTPINLERALRVGDELGGHILSGHVDGLASVLSSTPEHGSTRWRFAAPPDLAGFIAPKGSVALNGVSLTVNEVDGALFGVNIIPHTEQMTNFGTLKPGDAINLEIDMLARYVARLANYRPNPQDPL